MHLHTYHKDEGAKTLCKGLTNQLATDVNGMGHSVQVELLFPHVARG